MTIETAKPEDWPAIQEIFRRAGQAAWVHIMSAEALAGLAPPDRWREAIQDPARTVLVVKHEGQVKGFSVIEGDEVDSFYTDPSVWGLGAGRALMQAALEHLKEQGYQEGFLWTEVRNYRPRRFYEQGGWQHQGESRKRTVRGSDLEELRYRIRL